MCLARTDEPSTDLQTSISTFGTKRPEQLLLILVYEINGTVKDLNWI